MTLANPFAPAPKIKAMINIGATMDIPTGYWQTGQYGQKILNGGLAPFTGVTSIGNNGKSTFMHWMVLTALSRIACQSYTFGSTYDTEYSASEDRITQLSEQLEFFKEHPIFENEYWRISTPDQYPGNKWFKALKDFIAAKEKDKANLVDTPFLDRDGKLMRILVPTFGELDSLTEFTTEADARIMDDNELGESGANTLFARSGLIKSRMISEFQPLCSRGSHFLSVVAHLGKEVNMATGPMPAVQSKTLQFLKNGDAIKGASKKLTFLSNNCWLITGLVPYINQNTKLAEFPHQGVESKPGDTDLNILTIRQIRGKAGGTGYSLELIFSQSEGVLPSLTEFHHIRSNKYFGLVGSNQNYHLALYPDVALMRTTVRDKIASDPLLQRAVNITSELLQLKYYHRQFADIWVEPEELYKGIKEKGYDWNQLLATRGWWTINDDTHPVPFLSSVDLLRMNAGQYHPYWLESDKRTIKEKKK